MAGFSHVTMKLKEMYQMITLGGDAELELVDSLDPFSEGAPLAPSRCVWCVCVCVSHDKLYSNRRLTPSPS